MVSNNSLLTTAAAKLATTATGIDVTGVATLGTSSVGTDNTAPSALILRHESDQSSGFDDNFGVGMKFNADASNGGYATHAELLATQKSTGYQLRFKVGGTERLNLDSTGRFVVTPAANGHAVFNEGGVDADFRVESATNANAFFVDGTNGNVGIGISSPGAKLDIDIGIQTTLGLRSQTGVRIVQDTGLPSVGNRAQIGLGYGNTYTNVSIGAVRTSAAAYGTDDFIIATKSGTADTAPTERLRVDSSGNVGIGGTPTTFSGYITVHHKNTSGDAIHLIESDGGIIGQTFVNDASGVVTTGSRSDHPWRVTTNDTERMRINSTGGLITKPEAGGHAVFNEDGANADFRVESATSTHALFVQGSDGNVFVGGASENVEGAFTIRPNTSNGSCLIQMNRASTVDTSNAIVFYNAGAGVGSITYTDSATAFNTSSDARLKDVTGEARGLEVINALNPVAYNWKNSGKADEGLIAQEVMEIVPKAVSKTPDDMYQMDYSKLVVHLVKGMKEQQAIIDNLTTRITALES
jgi:hypothetical protein